VVNVSSSSRAGSNESSLVAGNPAKPSSRQVYSRQKSSCPVIESSQWVLSTGSVFIQLTQELDCQNPCSLLHLPLPLLRSSTASVSSRQSRSPQCFHSMPPTLFAHCRSSFHPIDAGVSLPESSLSAASTAPVLASANCSSVRLPSPFLRPPTAPPIGL
jgi:hypothetical protein